MSQNLAKHREEARVSKQEGNGHHALMVASNRTVLLIIVGQWSFKKQSAINGTFWQRVFPHNLHPHGKDVFNNFYAY